MKSTVQTPKLSLRWLKAITMQGWYLYRNVTQLKRWSSKKNKREFLICRSSEPPCEEKHGQPVILGALLILCVGAFIVYSSPSFFCIFLFWNYVACLHFFPLFPVENERERVSELFHKFLWQTPNCFFELSVEWIKIRVFWISLKLS